MSDLMQIGENVLCELRSAVKERVDEKRYAHTLAVEKKTVEIASVFVPDKVSKLRAAAILHDITKNLTTEEHIALCEKFGYPLKPFTAPPILHSITAPLVIVGELAGAYPVLNDPEILCAVRWHATGHSGMTTTESVVYLADYIEDTREYDQCRELREYYASGIGGDLGMNYLHLYKTMVISFDYTIGNLIGKKKTIDPDTVEARNYFLSLISDPEKGFE
jgi:nicotinate-nucleotide adenylyltransferase